MGLTFKLPYCYVIIKLNSDSCYIVRYHAPSPTSTLDVQYGDVLWDCVFTTLDIKTLETIYDWNGGCRFYTTHGEDGPKAYWGYQPNYNRPDFDDILFQIVECCGEYADRAVGCIKRLPPS